jgi:hypothetical protein
MNKDQTGTKKIQSQRLRNKLLIQCIVDAKLNGLTSYTDQLNIPDSYLRVLIFSIADVIDSELKYLAKRLKKEIDKKANRQTVYR